MAQSFENNSSATEESTETPLSLSGKLRRLNLFRKGADILVKLPGSEKYVPFLRQVASESLCRYQYGRGDMPLTVGIETTATCNRACGYCTVPVALFRERHPVRYMESSLFQKVLHDLSQFPRVRGSGGFCGTLHLNGFGEPLMDKHITVKVTQARSMLPDARIGFYSNGDLLNRDRYVKLKEAGLDEILITPHDGSHKQELIDLAQEFSADHIISLRPPLAAFANRGGEVELDSSVAQQTPPRHCIHPTYALEIFSDGQVAYCANDSLLKRPMGNVADSSVLEVWDDPGYKNLRNDLRRGHVERLPEVCLACRTTKQ